MPHVYLNEINKLQLLRTLESGRFLGMAFHSWDLYEFPLLQSTTAHSWAVKAATQLEKPRYVIFALQTGRRNAATKDASLFDACDLSNVKLFLNSTFYPYDDMHLDFAKNRYAILYDMYVRFRRAYYALDRDDDGAVLTMNKFLHCGPLVVLDCARQTETVKSATVDVRIEFDCRHVRRMRILGRRYNLTRTGYKFLEIGIGILPTADAVAVHIVLGDTTGKEILLTPEMWKGLVDYCPPWLYCHNLRQPRAG
ncbi:hypothetical protein DMN91_005570 [Ooceraea biroi]|uniref:Double jelly roll-like domain-containing protein n=1 Tax=Ooceraea biroi TaxID=2015173 RepID=A0A3L8DLC0_OOCBI|nr:hypothetical protein DMN91_005570 [Ooceraea biroi]